MFGYSVIGVEEGKTLPPRKFLWLCALRLNLIYSDNIDLLPQFPLSTTKSTLGFVFISNSTTSPTTPWQLFNHCDLLSVHQSHPQILTLSQPLPLIIPPNRLAQRVAVLP